MKEMKKDSNAYNIDFWEKVLKNLPLSYKQWFEEERKYLQSNITKDAKVLEVGCGEGRSLKDIINITENLTGIDHDPDAIKEAKTNLKGFSKIKLLTAEAADMPFKDKSFDFVICMTTFANFGNKKYKVLEEMKRVLADKGSIILSVFSEEAFEERMKLYKKTNLPIKEITGTTVIYNGKWGDNTSEQFSQTELEEIFAKVKLKIIEIKKLNISYICKLRK
jgi:ubiquinone/menaquinone biosynthesis C-methylase UbiE